jgi:CrcB protein
LGALARFLIGECVRVWTPLSGWTAVMASNLVGTAMLAALGVAASTAALPQEPAATWAFAATGFCGALTTYSAFGLDTVLLWYEGRRTLALAQMGATVAIGLAAAEAIALRWGGGA